MDDATSAVLLVAPSFNASLIGAGPTGAPLQPLFGNVDFKAYNIDFENRAVSKKPTHYWFLYLIPYTGQFFYISSFGDRHLLRKCVVLWMLLC